MSGYETPGGQPMGGGNSYEGDDQEKEQSAPPKKPFAERLAEAGLVFAGEQFKKPADFDAKHANSPGDEALGHAQKVRDSLDTLSFLLNSAEKAVRDRGREVFASKSSAAETRQTFTKAEVLGLITGFIDCHQALADHFTPEGKELLAIHAESHPNSSLHPQDIYQIGKNSPQLLQGLEAQKKAIEELSTDKTFRPNFVEQIIFHSRDILGGALSQGANQSPVLSRDGAFRDHNKTVAAHVLQPGERPNFTLGALRNGRQSLNKKDPRPNSPDSQAPGA
jgi:hypothetical protein